MNDVDIENLIAKKFESHSFKKETAFDAFLAYTQGARDFIEIGRLMGLAELTKNLALHEGNKRYEAELARLTGEGRGKE